jgi:hypothetical protein
LIVFVLEGSAWAQQRYTFGEWYEHKPIAWAGTSFVILGLGAGIGFGLAAWHAGVSADATRAVIQTEVALGNVPGVKDPQTVCNPSVLAKNPSANALFGAASASQACPILQRDLDAQKTRTILMASGWGLFGLGVVGTAVYAMVDWFPHRATIAPIVSPAMNGLGVAGTF